MENKARRVGRFINEDVSLSGSSTAASLEVIGSPPAGNEASSFPRPYNFDIIFRYETPAVHLYDVLEFR